MFNICFDCKRPKSEFYYVLYFATKSVEHEDYYTNRKAKIEQHPLCFMRTRVSFSMTEMDLVLSKAVMQDAEPL